MNPLALDDGIGPCPPTDVEAGIIRKLALARIPAATSSKRFVRDLANGRIVNLTERGRAFLAFIAHRFRRQYSLTEEEWAWVRVWLHGEDA